MQDNDDGARQVVESIKSSLSENRPEVRYEEDGTSITIFPEGVDAFLIWFRKDDEEYAVGSDGPWHEHFSDPHAAFEYIGFLLSEQCRIRVTSRGTFDYRWNVEAWDGDTWRGAGETGLLFFPFWRRKRVRYLQNHVIKLGEE